MSLIFDACSDEHEHEASTVQHLNLKHAHPLQAHWFADLSFRSGPRLRFTCWFLWSREMRSKGWNDKRANTDKWKGRRWNWVNVERQWEERERKKWRECDVRRGEIEKRSWKRKMWMLKSHNCFWNIHGSERWCAHHAVTSSRCCQKHVFHQPHTSVHDNESLTFEKNSEQKAKDELWTLYWTAGLQTFSSQSKITSMCVLSGLLFSELKPVFVPKSLWAMSPTSISLQRRKQKIIIFVVCFSWFIPSLFLENYFTGLRSSRTEQCEADAGLITSACFSVFGPNIKTSAAWLATLSIRCLQKLLCEVMKQLTVESFSLLL